MSFIPGQFRRTLLLPLPRARRGISLIEVLVVAGILTFVLAMLVPGMNKAREQAWRVQCKNNLHQWGIAFAMYSDEHLGYIPTEGGGGKGVLKSGTWFNELPQYLGLPPYRDIRGVNTEIEEHRDLHVWICPAKQKTITYKSGSGKNQFHYGMNQVLDGMGSPPNGSKDTPGFPDRDRLRAAETDSDEVRPLHASVFKKKPTAVLLFDIVPNSPSGSPRAVATMHARGYRGESLGRFHGDYANLLLINGHVENARTDDIVEDRDFRRGKIIWNNPKIYWGYPPPTGLPQDVSPPN